MGKSNNRYKQIITSTILALALVSASLTVSAETSSNRAENQNAEPNYTHPSLTQSQLEKFLSAEDLESAYYYREQLIATGGLAGISTEMADMPREQYNMMLGWLNVYESIENHETFKERLKQHAQPRIDQADKRIKIVVSAKMDVTTILENAGFSEEAISDSVDWLDRQLKHPIGWSHSTKERRERWCKEAGSKYWPVFVDSELAKFGVTKALANSVQNSIAKVLAKRLKEIQEIRILERDTWLEYCKMENVMSFQKELEKEFNSNLFYQPKISKQI